MKYLITILFLPCIIIAQDLDSQLALSFDAYKEQSINVRRFKHRDIQSLIKKMDANQVFRVRKLGESIEGRRISLISIGKGNIDILLWSQMHGNESTATMAIFDVLNFLADKNSFKSEKEELLKSVRLHFLPMLNPDGAEQFKRRNALDIDINRDALRLQSPEGRILKSARDSLDAEFGFNLHDQSKYYNAELTDKPATISYLAPAYNYAKDINDVRSDAMKIIVHMNNIVKKYIPGQVGRYSDDFEPRAFGDNIQKWGTSAILIESGGHYADPEKQFIRKLNYISILSAIFTIADGSYKEIALEDYEKIPTNDRKLFDVKIENLTYRLLGKDYQVDVGIIRDEIDNSGHSDFHYSGRIDEVGDLSTYYGYQTIDATGLRYEIGKQHTEKKYEKLGDADFKMLLDGGYTSILLGSLPDDIAFSKYPMNLVITKKPIDELKLGNNATFLLMSDDQIRYVIVNGFVYDPSGKEIQIKNGLIR